VELRNTTGQGARWWAGPLLAASVTALLIGVPELIVRAIDPPLREYRAIRFGGDPSSPRLFVRDPRLHWRLRAGAELEFLGTRVETDASGWRVAVPRSRGERTALCLGDSTTFGWGVEGRDAFPAVLERILNERAGHEDWRVLNAGVPGYSSFQVRLLAMEIIPGVRPEVVVVSLGNNEAAPAEHSDRDIDAARSMAAWADAALAATRFGSWVADRLFPQRSRRFDPTTWDGRTRRVAPQEFVANIGAIVATARAHGARPVVLAPAVNLYAPPVGLKALPDGDAAIAWCTRVAAAIDQGDAAGAMAQIDARLVRDPGNFYALWLKGYALTQQGDAEGGRAAVEEAFERDPFPDRSPLTYRRVLADSAARDDIVHLDVNALFRLRKSPHILDEFFIDHCHPDPRGHRLIAEALADLIGTEPAGSGS
jgi:lysophospholipase L1-like esterase